MGSGRPAFTCGTADDLAVRCADLCSGVVDRSITGTGDDVPVTHCGHDVATGPDHDVATGPGHDAPTGPGHDAPTAPGDDAPTAPGDDDRTAPGDDDRDGPATCSRAVSDGARPDNSSHCGR
ncbi:MAG TPA: hypothetical protein VLN74_06470 [Ilumatobacteraceae bacterium]|nr:hypothetical protein [Ilumatobacteraceae bacterium]